MINCIKIKGNNQQVLQISHNDTTVIISKIGDEAVNMVVNGKGFGRDANYTSLKAAVIELMKDLKLVKDLKECVQQWYNRHTQLPLWNS